MNKVEAGRQILTSDVVPQNLETRVAGRFRFQKVCLQIGGDDHATRSDTLGEPESHRASAGTNLKATPAWTGTQTGEVLVRTLIKSSLQTGQPDPLLTPSVVIHVVLSHAPALYRDEQVWRGST
jgi:hypothetical protein